MLAARYPYYHDAVRTARARRSSVRWPGRSGCARRALGGLSVVIDARILAGPMTGTQLHVLELIAALARTGQARVTAIVPERPAPDAARALARLDGVKLLTRGAARGAARPARRRRPPAVPGHDEEDLALPGRLRRAPDRHPPGPDRLPQPVVLQRLRRVAGVPAPDPHGAGRRRPRRVLLRARPRRARWARICVEPERASVVHIGVDHRLRARCRAGRRRRARTRLPDGAPVILCLGTDFAHKNRVFALRLLERAPEPARLARAARVRRAAGRATAPPGRASEALAGARPRLAGAVLDLGAVSEAEKAWLYAPGGGWSSTRPCTRASA